MSSERYGLCVASLALAVACGGSSGVGAPATGGTGSQAQAGSGTHLGGSGTGGGASGGGASGVGGAPDGSSALGGSAGRGGGGGAGGGGAGGTNANSAPKCAPAQIYCNGSCLQKVGDSVGNCSALLLENSQTASLAADGTYLYFTHANQSVDRLQLSSLATTSLVSGLKFPQTLLLDGDTLYFTTDWTESTLGGDFAKGTLRKIPKAGGSATVLAQGLDSPNALELSAGSLYFTTGFFGPLQLNQASVGGGSVKALGGALAPGVRAFVADGDTVYYANSAGISATHLTDLSQSTSVAPNVVADVLWADSGKLYFLGMPSFNAVTTFGRVDKAGGTPQTMPLSVGVRFEFRDSVAAYVVGPNVDGEQLLYRLTLADGALAPLATFEHDQIAAVTADESAVYVGLDLGGIVRIAK